MVDRRQILPKLVLIAAAAVAAGWVFVLNRNEVSTGTEAQALPAEVGVARRQNGQVGKGAPDLPSALDASVKATGEASHSGNSARVQRELKPQPRTNSLVKSPSHGPVPQTATEVELSASAVAEWRQTVWEDCHGQGITDCQKMIDTFTRILEAPDYVDDGWSEWMEKEILTSLNAKASEYEATKVNAKCAAEGCVFVLYANSAREMFDHGWRHANEFDKWLRKEPWNQWLEVHSRQSSKESTLGWRMVGSPSVKPFINWYVVTRRQ